VCGKILWQTDASGTGILPVSNSTGWKPVPLFVVKACPIRTNLRNSLVPPHNVSGISKPTPETIPYANGVMSLAKDVKKPVARTTAVICGLGYYELRLNDGRWLLPILQFQTGNAAEFPGVMSHQGQSIRQRNRRDQQVVWADKHAQTGQLCANPAVLVGCTIIKGQRLKLPTKDLNLAQVLLLARASVCVL